MSKARELASLGNAYSDGALSNRNLIINGAMQVAQRGTSATAFGAPTFPSIDRFKCFKQSDGGTITGEQSTDAPDGFYYSMKSTVTSSDATPTGVNAISYWVEGSDGQHLGFGTDSAQTCTLSFWVKSSIAGTYSVVIQDNNYVVSYVAEYSIASANTWEKKVVTFAGPTTGSWGKTSATSSLRIWWDMGSTDSETTSTVNQWAGRAFRGASSVRLIETSGATFYLTGVQLEIGDTATPFEHRSYGQELALCQRYYQKQPIPQYVYPTDAGQLTWVVPLSVPLRTTPTITAKSAFYAHRKDASGIVTLWDGAGSYSASVYEYEAGEISIRNNFDGGVVAGIYTINASPTLNNTNSGLAKLYFDAEL